MPYVAAIAGVVYTQCAVATARRVQVEWPRRYVFISFFLIVNKLCTMSHVGMPTHRGAKFNYIVL